MLEYAFWKSEIDDAEDEWIVRRSDCVAGSRPVEQTEKE